MKKKEYNNIVYSLKSYENLEGTWTKIPSDAFEIIRNGNCFMIYCYLCKMYNKSYGYAFPTIEQISNDIGMSNKTIHKCIKQLEDIGLIKVLKFKEKTTQYANNIYMIYYPNIIKNKLKEKEKKELEEMIKEADEEILNKIRTIDLEMEEDNSDNDEQ